MQSILIIIGQNSRDRSGRRIGVAEVVPACFDLKNRVLGVLARADNSVAAANGLAVLRYVSEVRAGSAHSRGAVGGDHGIQNHAAVFYDPIGENAAVRRVMLGARARETASRLHLY